MVSHVFHIGVSVADSVTYCPQHLVAVARLPGKFFHGLVYPFPLLPGCIGGLSGGAVLLDDGRVDLLNFFMYFLDLRGDCSSDPVRDGVHGNFGFNASQQVGYRADGVNAGLGYLGLSGNLEQDQCREGDCNGGDFFGDESFFFEEPIGCFHVVDLQEWVLWVPLWQLG